MFSFEARLAGRIAASIPARTATPTKRRASRSEPRTRSRTGRAPRSSARRGKADGDPERRADEGGDDALLPDHPPHLAAGHADRPQHPQLARALEDREHERVDDAEQAHDHGQPEQRVEDLERLVEVARSGGLELVAGLDDCASGNADEAPLERARCSPRTGRRAMFSRVRSLSWSANERSNVARRDRDRAERRAALGRVDDAGRRGAGALAPVGDFTVSGEPTVSEWSSA